MNDETTLDTMPQESLEDEIATLSATLAAATHRLIMLVGELDRREAWADPTGATPCRSCAHWLSWRAGISLGTARQYVKLAKVLPTVPRISEAFSKGELSYSKVRALGRVVTPETEGDLLAWALAGTASHVEELVRRFRKGGRTEENEQGVVQREGRRLSMYFDDGGMLVIEGRLMPEQGAVVMKAVERALESLRVPAGTGPRRSDDDGDQVMADALALVADQALASGSAGTSTPDRFQVMIHVDQEVLENPDADGKCELANGPTVPAETARRLACDGSVCEVTHGPDGEVMAGRRTRVISAPLRRALAARDGTRCTWPGCACRSKEIHHVEHWANGGETVLQNLTSTCAFHHHLIHEGGARVEALPDGGFRYFWPNGTEAVAAPPRPELAVTGAWRMAMQFVPRGVEIGPETGRPTWMGERADYDFMGDVLRRPEVW
jgi:hypothetical protein